ncbi:MAG: hypothetical protein JWM10_4147 [Myxococcaceae bacterium]|nr:hypothetical protein [Myxococcaceae bacterium]
MERRRTTSAHDTATREPSPALREGDGRVAEMPIPLLRATVARSLTADVVFELLVEKIAERVAERLGATPEPGYYTQHENPLGRRRFLEAARRGAFPSAKQGKLVLARREDVDRWLRSRERPSAESRTAGVEEDLDALLEGAGVLAPGVTVRVRHGRR